MKLTVDASVVVKWFVAEPMYEEARLALGLRIELHAPELVLAESANTLRKKSRRKELVGPQPYLNELGALPDVIVLWSARRLIERAIRIAFEIDHAIYDCLHLACAETTGSELIAADKRFADNAAKRSHGPGVRCIGAPGVVDWLAAGATAPVIRRETVEGLIAAHDAFERTEQSVLDALFDETVRLRIPREEDRKLFLDSPAYRRLVDSIRKLSTEESIDLLALGWLGAESFPDWRRCHAHAEEMVTTLDPAYAASYGHAWRAGYARLTGGQVGAGGADHLDPDGMGGTHPGEAIDRTLDAFEVLMLPVPRCRLRWGIHGRAMCPTGCAIPGWHGVIVRGAARRGDRRRGAMRRRRPGVPPQRGRR